MISAAVRERIEFGARAGNATCSALLAARPGKAKMWKDRRATGLSRVGTGRSMESFGLQSVFWNSREAFSNSHKSALSIQLPFRRKGSLQPSWQIW